MSEGEVVKATPGDPATEDSIAADLASLGVQPGIVLLVHSSLRSLGWVCGSSVAVIYALEKALGPDGTLVMPTFTSDLTDPAEWRKPPVPEPWCEIIRNSTPGFDPDLTPTRQMGAIVETFRKREGVVRSNHPITSFCARGPLAEKITSGHELENCLGEGSPLARIYENDGWVLLLGVSYDRNSSMHLAEYRTDYPGKLERVHGSPLMVDGKREWVTFKDIETRDDLLPDIGRDFESETDYVKAGKIAQAESRLFSQRALVDFTRDWLMTNIRKNGDTCSSG